MDFTDPFNLQRSVISISPQIGIGERVRRTIFDLSFVYHNPSNSLADHLAGAGIQILLECTRGNPPPIPAFITTEDFSDRDVLHQQHAFGRFVTGVNQAVFYMQVPADGAPFHGDHEVSRGDGVLPVALWLNWGIMPAPPSGNFNCRIRSNWAVLVETL